jgi:adenylate cyclase
MTEIIFEKKGVVDKFIGDAIMAFWGAPLKNDNQENDAVSTALKMIEKLKKDKYEINIGIAINTGEVVVGNLGSQQRFDYTVIGDDVKLATRRKV